VGDRIAILGAGGHAKVVCDALRRSLVRTHGAEIVGFFDDDRARWGQTLMGVPIHGPIERLPDVPVDRVIVGIGDNAVRRRLAEWVAARGYRLVNAIHPTAVIGEDVTIGEGVAIFANVVVNPGSSIGDHVILNTGAIVDHDCQVGDGAHLAPRATLAGGVIVGEGTFVGTSAAIVPYRKVGRWAVIGAGTVVIDDVPDDVVAVGVPAKFHPKSREP